MIEDSFSKRCNVSDPDPSGYYGYEDLGYGDGAPDVAHYADSAPSLSVATSSASSSSEVDYGYGDGAPNLGYGDGAPDTAANNQPKKQEEVEYGYGDASPEMGYGDAAPDSANADASGEQRRPRRRNSVTRCSVVDADSVETEFQNTRMSSTRCGMEVLYLPDLVVVMMEVPIKDGNNISMLSSRSNHSAHSDYSSDSGLDGDFKAQEETWFGQPVAYWTK